MTKFSLLKCLLFLLPFLFFSNTLYAQIDTSRSSNTPLDLRNKPAGEFNSSDNIRRFADYLFCEKDYLRAAEEYDKYLSNESNDTILFKQGLSFSYIGQYKSAIEKLSALPMTSSYYASSRAEIRKVLFISGDSAYNFRTNDKSIKKLFAAARLLYSDDLPGAEVITSAFDEKEKMPILNFYNRKKEDTYKSPLAAGLFSAIIPGSGKIYTGNLSDGLTSFVINSLLGYISYAAFKADHKFRGYLFGGLTFFFYAGNIYGSAAGAQLHNEGIREQYNSDLKDYIKSNNYFMRDYDFCR